MFRRIEPVSAFMVHNFNVVSVVVVAIREFDDAYIVVGDIRSRAYIQVGADEIFWQLSGAVAENIHRITGRLMVERARYANLGRDSITDVDYRVIEPTVC